jgi:hypothetical protein
LRRLAGGKPRLARLPALPGAGGETENFHFHAATLQRARQDIRAGRGHRDGASAHRSGIVQKQRNHSVAEGGFLLVHERQRVIGIGHHPRQARRIENAFLEIEFPGAVLLRHQSALEAVGEPRDDALQMRELLVEIAAQALQLIMVAQVFGRDHLVEFWRKGVIFRAARLVGAARIRPRCFARRLVVAEFAILEGVRRGSLRAFHRAFRHLVGGGLGLIGAHLLRGIRVGRAFRAGLVVLAVAAFVLVLVLVGLGIAVVAEFECGQQIMHRITEFRLILGKAVQPVEPRTDLVFQHRPPEVDHLAGSRRRREAGQALTHQHRQRIGQWRIGAVGDLVELAAMEMIVEHRGEILRNARHPPRAERLDTGLLDGFEYATCLRISRHQLAVNFRIVTGKLQRDRIGVAAHDRGIAPGHLARRLRQPRLSRRKARPLGGKRHFKLRLFRDRAQAGRDRAFERLGRRFLRSGAEFAVRRRHQALSLTPFVGGGLEKISSSRR